MTYAARQNAANILELHDAIVNLLDSDVVMTDEQYESLVATRRRIDYKRDRASWGVRPRLTLKQLAVATAFVANNW